MPQLVSYSYDKKGVQADPLTLLIEGATVNIVVRDLLDGPGSGWTKWTWPSVKQDIILDDYELEQDDELVTYSGLSNPMRFFTASVLRCHLRLWNIPIGTELNTTPEQNNPVFQIVGSAHSEYAIRPHRVLSFGDALDEVVSTLSGIGYEPNQSYQTSGSSSERCTLLSKGW